MERVWPPPGSPVRATTQLLLLRTVSVGCVPVDPAAAGRFIAALAVDFAACFGAPFVAAGAADAFAAAELRPALKSTAAFTSPKIAANGEEAAAGDSGVAAGAGDSAALGVLSPRPSPQACEASMSEAAVVPSESGFS